MGRARGKAPPGACPAEPWLKASCRTNASTTKGPLHSAGPFRVSRADVGTKRVAPLVKRGRHVYARPSRNTVRRSVPRRPTSIRARLSRAGASACSEEFRRPRAGAPRTPRETPRRPSCPRRACLPPISSGWPPSSYSKSRRNSTSSSRIRSLGLNACRYVGDQPNEGLISPRAPRGILRRRPPRRGR